MSVPSLSIPTKDLEEADSSELYQLHFPVIWQPIQMGQVFPDADVDKKSPFLFSFPWIHPLEVKGKFFLIYIIPETDGGFVTRVSTNRFSATGQGETEEEALQDLKSAIEALMEEETNPSGDVLWPEDFR